MNGVGGIRTLVPKKDKRISSAPHYDHFDTTPERFTLYLLYRPSSIGINLALGILFCIINGSMR